MVHDGGRGKRTGLDQEASGALGGFSSGVASWWTGPFCGHAGDASRWNIDRCTDLVKHGGGVTGFVTTSSAPLGSSGAV